jgi:hypothetical protein
MSTIKTSSPRATAAATASGAIFRNLSSVLITFCCTAPQGERNVRRYRPIAPCASAAYNDAMQQLPVSRRALAALLCLAGLSLLPGSLRAQTSATNAPAAQTAEPPVSTPAPATIREADLGVTFATPTVPRGWRHTRKKAGSHLLQHDGEKDAFGVLTVEAQRVALAELSSAEMTKILRETITEDPEFKEVKEKSAKTFKTASGITGARLEFDAKLENVPMRCVIIGFTRNGRVAIFTGLCPSKSVKTYLSGFDAAARSLTVTNAAPPAPAKP